MVETGIHKMIELGLPVDAIVTASGTCPVAPVAGDDLTAMGRTNDAVLYGGTAWYALRGEDETIGAVAEQLVSACSTDYGRPFLEIFEEYDRDFYKIDPMLFSPAEVFVNNLASGRTFHAGKTRGDLLARSWFL
jgi:methenyltetrahydromethanopterin cyclohydrolase